MDAQLRVSVLLIGLMLSLTYIKSLSQVITGKDVDSLFDRLEETIESAQSIMGDKAKYILAGITGFFSAFRLLIGILFIAGSYALLSPSPLMYVPLILIFTDSFVVTKTSVKMHRWVMADTLDRSVTMHRYTLLQTCNLIIVGLIVGIII